MEIKEITVKQVREILETIITNSKALAELSQMSDENLLDTDTDIAKKFGLDSLDVEELFAEIYYQYGIRISDADIDRFREKPTAENFIRICNDCGYGV